MGRSKNKQPVSSSSNIPWPVCTRLDVVVKTTPPLKMKSRICQPIDTPTQCNMIRLQNTCSTTMEKTTNHSQFKTPRPPARSLLFPILTIRWYTWSPAITFHHHPPSTGSLRCEISTCNLYPLGYAAALLAFDVDNVRIAATSAPDAIFLRCIPFRPVIVLFFSCLVVQGRDLKVRLSF